MEVVAEGEKLKLNVLIEKLWQGPRASRVDAIDIEERKFTGEFETFESVIRI